MKRGIVLLMTTLLCGCVSLNRPQPAIRHYRLDYAAPAKSAISVSAVVRIAPVYMAAVFDRDAMVYTARDYQVGAYPYDRWSTNPGEMITDLLTRDFSTSGGFGGIQQGLSTLAPDYQLQVFVDRIEEVRDLPGCKAVFVARAGLERLLPDDTAKKSDPALFQRVYQVEEPVTCDAPFSLAEALSRAVQQTSQEIQQDCLTAIAADQRQP